MIPPKTFEIGETATYRGALAHYRNQPCVVVSMEIGRLVNVRFPAMSGREILTVSPSELRKHQQDPDAPKPDEDPDAYPGLEEDLERDLKSALRGLGFEVLKVGGKRQGGNANDRGVADLLVGHDTWPVGISLEMELKAKDTRLRPEQKDRAQRGRILIVRSVQRGVEAALAMHRRLSGTPAEDAA